MATEAQETAEIKDEEPKETPAQKLEAHRLLHQKWRAGKFKVQVWLTEKQYHKASKAAKKAGYKCLAPFARQLLTGSAIIQKFYGTPDKVPEKRAS